MLINYLRVVFVMFLFIGLAMDSFAQDHTNIAIANEYYKNNELEKAKALYDDLVKDPDNIPVIHTNYFELLINMGEYDNAEKYIERLIKRNPENMLYKVDLGRIYERRNEEEKVAGYFYELIDQYKSDPNRLRILAQFFINRQLVEYAIDAYRKGRQHADVPFIYAIELANAYRYVNNKEGMIAEYLNFAQQHERNISYVQNVLQSVLVEDGDMERLETFLINKVQDQPDNQIYNQLLVWVNLQQKNFYGAFVQARAVDKRFRRHGSMVMDVGNIALENNDYSNAIRIFEYVIKEYPNTINYAMAKSLVIKSREELIKNTFPVDNDEIRNLIKDYRYLIAEIGINGSTVEALRSKALLHAFYLDEFDSAILILENIIDLNGINSTFKGKCKLDLGDIYLLIDQPWESSLLYSQVEKSHKETTIGYEAKLKNARLSFYKGEFSLAQEHLDILKEATTREIANDAMALSLLIQDNTAFDSVNAALYEYASIELLLFRNKKLQAMDSLNKLIHKYSNHNIIDEALFMKAKINQELGNFEDAIVDLMKIVTSYNYDILSDDAYYLIGTIYEDNLGDEEKAMEIYQDFLKKYPGSLFVADARKRFRNLRGDYSNVVN